MPPWHHCQGCRRTCDGQRVQMDLISADADPYLGRGHRSVSCDKGMAESRALYGTIAEGKPILANQYGLSVVTIQQMSSQIDSFGVWVLQYSL